MTVVVPQSANSVPGRDADRPNAVSPLLKAGMTPQGHRAHLFFRKDYVVFLKKMMLLMATVGQFSGMLRPEDAQRLSTNADGQFLSVLPVVCSGNRRAERRSRFMWRKTC